MIKNITIEELRTYAVEILTKTYMELNQNPTEDTIVGMSLSLAEDLQEDFESLEIEDIRKSFRIGVRDTDSFNIGPKTWYKWITAHRQIIWDNETIEPNMQDKRLNYRSRNGAGIQRLSEVSTKLIK
tara:strand:- start:491 stop:871 length:381 start_codon:yes stop_codon:yes gene_type:complete